jgi:hypothetical protein
MVFGPPSRLARAAAFTRRSSSALIRVVNATPACTERQWGPRADVLVQGHRDGDEQQADQGARYGGAAGEEGVIGDWDRGGVSGPLALAPVAMVVLVVMVVVVVVFDGIDEAPRRSRAPCQFLSGLVNLSP